MHKKLNFPSIPINHIKPLSELLFNVLSGEIKTDKGLESFFKQNQILEPSEKKKYRDYTYKILFNWYLIEKNFPKESRQPSRLIKLINKNGQIALNLQNVEWIDNGFPKEFLDLLKKEWPIEYLKIAESLNQLPFIFLRVNTLLGFNPQAVESKLRELGARTLLIDNPCTAIKITNAFDLYRTELFKESAFEQQDLASQLVSYFVNPQPGQWVADACAGNGGKSLHLASLMKNKGRLLCTDIYRNKIKVLRSRLKKAGINNAEARLVESTKDIKKLYDKFDKVLIDAPCTGSGVYRRNPESRYYFSLEGLNNLVNEQKEILNRYFKLVKPGGELIYATCSVLKAEGEQQIKNFLEQQKDKFQLVEEKRIMPYDYDCDGFYMAKLIRLL